MVLLPACCLGGVAKRILEKKPLETLSVPTGCPSLDKLYVFIVFSDQSRWVEKINISRSVWTPQHNLEHHHSAPITNPLLNNFTPSTFATTFASVSPSAQSFPVPRSQPPTIRTYRLVTGLSILSAAVLGDGLRPTLKSICPAGTAGSANISCTETPSTISAFISMSAGRGMRPACPSAWLTVTSIPTGWLRVHAA